jgi:3-oxoacyl-[acyl-carrier-protein] synthase III
MLTATGVVGRLPNHGTWPQIDRRARGLASAPAGRYVSVPAPGNGARIVATGAHLPGEPITNENIEALVGPLPDGMLEGMHMQRRHWIVDPSTGEHTDSTSGMAARALEQALARACIEPAALELLIVATASPDFVLPPTAALVQEQLGIDGCAILELRSGGAGVVQGLDIARLYLEHGRYRNAAVVGAEAISPLQAQLLGAPRLRIRERLLAYMFGDGAGAIVLERCERSAMSEAAMAGIGVGREPGMQILGAGGTHAPYAPRPNGRLLDMVIDIEQASTFTATLTTEAVRDVLSRTGLEAESIDLCVTPEADTDWMRNALCADGSPAPEWLVLEGRIFNALPELGAPGCAALPLGLDLAWTTGRVTPGQRVLLLAMETTKWIYAAMVVDWTAPYRPSQRRNQP